LYRTGAAAPTAMQKPAWEAAALAKATGRAERAEAELAKTRAPALMAPARKDTPMSRVVTDDDRRADGATGLDEIVREGARQMLAAALEAEVDAYVAAFADEGDETGRRVVVRNGDAEPRTIRTAAGAMEIEAPRVNDRRVDPDSGERQRFRSWIVPPWCPKSPKVTEVLPLLCLHGMSTGDFVPALEGFFGSRAGLSSPVITRLASRGRPSAPRSPTGISPRWTTSMCGRTGCTFKVRLEEADLCALVMVGVRADGSKELVAIADGLRESTESWADVLRDLKRRGMRVPVLAVGDGALGFWGALPQVFPQCRHQRDWVHKLANTLGALPKSAHPSAQRMLADIRDAEDREHAVRAIEAFARDFAVRWPKAVTKIVDDTEELLAFFDFPAEHWIHLKTSDERVKPSAA
jgi:putative transposase